MMSPKTALLLALTCGALHVACASEKSNIPPMSPNNVNLSAADLLLYMQSGDVQQNLLVDAFILGVLDATEGQDWCDYSKFKIISLRERIFSELKKMEKADLEKRAAHVIKDILEERMPCGASK